MNINRNGYDGFRIDIEIYSRHGKGVWAQRRYLVHGIDDVMWTNSIDEALSYFLEELKRLEKLAPQMNNE
jgi:hypothetical protein